MVCFLCLLSRVSDQRSGVWAWLSNNQINIQAGFPGWGRQAGAALDEVRGRSEQAGPPLGDHSCLQSITFAGPGVNQTLTTTPMSRMGKLFLSSGISPWSQGNGHSSVASGSCRGVGLAPIALVHLPACTRPPCLAQALCVMGAHYVLLNEWSSKLSQNEHWVMAEDLMANLNATT